MIENKRLKPGILKLINFQKLINNNEVARIYAYFSCSKNIHSTASEFLLDSARDVDGYDFLHNFMKNALSVQSIPFWTTTLALTSVIRNILNFSHNMQNNYLLTKIYGQIISHRIKHTISYEKC